MFRVLVAVLLAALAIQVSGCTGSLRLGSESQMLAPIAGLLSLPA